MKNTFKKALACLMAVSSIATGMIGGGVSASADYQFEIGKISMLYYCGDTPTAAEYVQLGAGSGRCYVSAVMRTYTLQGNLVDSDNYAGAVNSGGNSPVISANSVRGSAYFQSSVYTSVPPSSAPTDYLYKTVPTF